LLILLNAGTSPVRFQAPALAGDHRTGDWEIMIDTNEPTTAAQSRTGRVVATDGGFALGPRALMLARRVPETASGR
jgi:hypothetical protein